MALGNDLPDTGATNRLSRICPCRHRTHRTPPASGASTPRSRQSVALAPSGCGPAGSTGGAVYRGGHDGGRNWGPAPVRYATRTDEVFGCDPFRVLLRGAAPAGFDYHSR